MEHLSGLHSDAAMSGEELASCPDIGYLEPCRVGECFQGFFRTVVRMSERPVRKQVNDL